MTVIQTILRVQEQFPPSSGWVVRYVTAGLGVRVQHAEHGTRLCWVHKRGRRIRIVVKEG
jgi:hypothetical protein